MVYLSDDLNYCNAGGSQQQLMTDMVHQRQGDFINRHYNVR